MSSRLTLTLTLALASPALASEGAPLVLEGVLLRDGVTADIHALVYDNDRVTCRSGALVVVHGATATARSMEPFAQAIAAAPPGGRPMCHVVNLDMPGHGASPPPSGAFMGDLTVQDYSAALVGVLEDLPAHGLRPVSVAGHSMGGMVVQLAQQRLLDRGSSLADLGVKRAILLAPAIPEAVPWAFRDAGGVAFLLSMLSVSDPILGDVIAIPPELLPSLFFGRLDGSIASTAIAAEDVIALGWTGPESVAAMMSMVGLEPLDPPHVEAGAFADAHGTALGVVAFEQDNVIFATDLGPLFTHLTGKDPSDPSFVWVAGDDAVHGMPQAEPEAVLHALEGRISLH
jgi:pimeloyl-ACP methyl ester carboxylesterase